jgi:hypothetical protein
MISSGTQPLSGMIREHFLVTYLPGALPVLKQGDAAKYIGDDAGARWTLIPSISGTNLNLTFETGDTAVAVRVAAELRWTQVYGAF